MNLVNRGELVQHGQWSNPAYAVVDGQPQVVFPGGDGWLYSSIPTASCSGSSTAIPRTPFMNWE